MFIYKKINIFQVCYFCQFIIVLNRIKDFKSKLQALTESVISLMWEFNNPA